MSVPLAEAREAAEALVEILRPACERIEIAGSIRRGKAAVKDIEIVAIPLRQEQAEGLWGDVASIDLLEERLVTLATDGTVTLRLVKMHRADGSIEYGQRNGESYKALEYRGIPVDLFLVHPGRSDWGVIFTIRTGPAEWSHRLVTDCQRLLRRGAGGRLYRSGQHYPCPEERDFFEGIGQAWIDPADRVPERVAIR